MHLFLAGALCAMAFTAAPQFYEEHVFPPEKVHNHSSTIVETPNGNLLVAWFHGRGEKTDDTLILLGARKEKGSSQWSRPFLLADNPGLPDQNPVLFIDPQGKLYLWWISSLANTRESFLLQYRTSMDYEGPGVPEWDWNGTILEQPIDLAGTMEKMAAGVEAKFGAHFDSASKYRERLQHGVHMSQIDSTYLSEWKEPVFGRLTGMLSWMPRTPPIMLTEKRMAIGLYSDLYLTSVTGFTEDGGKTWAYGAPMADYGLIQPALIARKDGTVVAYGRDKSPNKKVRVAESDDGGVHWNRFYDLAIPNPDSSVAVLKLAEGAWVMICNDLAGTDGRHGRSRLSAYLSEDEGKTWPVRRVIEDSTKGPTYRPHASYPSAIQTSDGLIQVTYTYTLDSGECIKRVAFNEDWVRAGK